MVRPLIQLGEMRKLKLRNSERGFVVIDHPSYFFRAVSH